jgi:tRNA(Ser,Leu) C12 N-acetylase TAN1
MSAILQMQDHVILVAMVGLWQVLINMYWNLVDWRKKVTIHILEKMTLVVLENNKIEARVSNFSVVVVDEVQTLLQLGFLRMYW